MEGDPLSENSLSVWRPAMEVPLAGTGEVEGSRSEEAALVEGCRTGDLAAFERLYEKEGSRMKSVAMNLLGNATDAEDAVQEAFLRIYRKASGFRGGSSFSTWTYRVLVNACYDLLRRRRGRPAQDSAETLREVPAPASDQALRLSLQRAIERLRERHRAVFVLFEVEGFSHREIAGVLGVSEGNSRSLLFEAKRELQRLLFPSARMGAAAS